MHFNDPDFQRYLLLEDNKNIMTLSDSDLSEISHLSDLVKKASNKVEYNQDSIISLHSSELNQYYQFLDNKLQEQHGVRLNSDKQFLLINYDGIVYYVAGIVPVNVEQDIDIMVSKDVYVKFPEISLDDKDMENIPKIKEGIENIGTYQISSFESAGIGEGEFERYEKWLATKYEEQFGNSTGAPISYFRYKDSYYSVSFAIC